MLRLRADVKEPDCENLVSALGGIGGVRRVTATDEVANGDRVVSADVAPGHADAVLSALHRARLHGDDYVLVREDSVTRRISTDRPGGEFSWVEIVGEARANARPVARYVTLMAVSGWIAGLGVITHSQILIIGAMAVSLDLLPLCATCVGVAGRRLGLTRQAFGTLAVGMALVMLVELAATVGLRATGLVGGDLEIGGGVIGALADADSATVMIALAAGVAAILSFETRAASAVGVAISVTTVPASAYFGVALALGHAGLAWGALLVLGINLACLVVAGTITLLLQRRFTPQT